MNVEWDDKKAEANLQKHGISFDEAATALLDPLALSMTDDASGEDRTVTLGVSSIQNLLVVVTLEVEGETVRIISARKATKKERKDYEEGV